MEEQDDGTLTLVEIVRTEIRPVARRDLDVARGEREPRKISESVVRRPKDFHGAIISSTNRRRS